jgi:hypothetical protein
MAYTATTWKEYPTHSAAQITSGLNNAETIYDELVTLFNAHDHDASYYTKTAADAKYFGSANDGSGSGLICETLDGYTYEEILNGIPSGIIAFWPYAEGTIPAGWYKCNGSNDTPNLIDRIIVGAGSDYYVGETGGDLDSSITPTISNTNSAEHTLTAAELPAHTHSWTETQVWSNTSGMASGSHYASRVTADSYTSGGATSAHSHTLTSFTVTSFDPRPSMYAGYWIMKG